MTATSDLACSVLMPAFVPSRSFSEMNWLKCAVRSVLDQSVTGKVEIILLDDSGVEPIWPSLQALLTRAEAKSIRVIKTPVNFGLVRALNLGLSQARAPLIARLDCDDYWAEDKLQPQLTRFQEDPDLSLSFMGMTLISDGGAARETHNRGMDWTAAIAFNQNVGCPIPHGTVVCRKDVMVAMGGYPYHPQSFVVEDLALWTQLMRFFKVEGLSRIGLFYRQHPKSLSALHEATQRDNSLHHRELARQLGDASVYVRAFTALAEAWGLSQRQCGERLRALWRYGGDTVVEKSRLDDLATVLFDRCIEAQAAANGAAPVRVSAF